MQEFGKNTVYPKTSTKMIRHRVFLWPSWRTAGILFLEGTIVAQLQVNISCKVKDNSATVYRPKETK